MKARRAAGSGKGSCRVQANKAGELDSSFRAVRSCLSF